MVTQPVMMGGMGSSADAVGAPAGRGPALRLPEPTGPWPAGTTSLWLTDTSRPDPWAPDANARELMVSLWYPAVRAGIDMDGSTAAPIPDEGLARPFLFLGKESNYTPGSGGAVAPGTREWKLRRGAVSTWERDWELLTGWKRWLVVAGAVHASFTDLALLAQQIGMDTGTGLSGARSLDPRLRPGLLRPAPARQATSPAGPALPALPGGHVLFPVGS